MKAAAAGLYSDYFSDDARFVKTYGRCLTNRQVYATSTGESATPRVLLILGRTDDVINIAGHRLGTREIEKYLQLPERSGSGGSGDKDALERAGSGGAFVIRKQRIARRARDEENAIMALVTTRSVTLSSGACLVCFAASQNVRSGSRFAARSKSDLAKAAIRAMSDNH